MTLSEVLQQERPARLTSEMARAAAIFGVQSPKAILAILNAAIANPELTPKITGESTSVIVNKWVRKFQNGFDNRISQRASNVPATVHDRALDIIIDSSISHLSTGDLNRIKYSHRLSMSAENILGLLLEEFLSIQLAEFGWHTCWGEVLRSVDFVSDDGRLLQVKNRSNSENSSSSRVRIGTAIKKWFRVNASDGSHQWDDLNRMHNTGKFTEDAFVAFIRETLRSNPGALAVEHTNPWLLRG